MDRTTTTGRITSRSSRRIPARTAGVTLAIVLLGGAAGTGPGLDTEAIVRQASAFGHAAVAWYGRTPAADRMTWGGIALATLFGLGVSLERMARLRRKKVIPADFVSRFLERLRDGRLDRGKALDFCELNPSPASRVALGAVKRWGRPVTDLERAVALAQRGESDRLRRNIGTLRRLAALAPLLGLLGTLLTLSRALSAADVATSWGPAVASALGPLTAGVAVAILALIAYDGLTNRAEGLVSALDLIAAQTIDAVAMALPPEPRPAPVVATPTPALPPSPGPARTPHQHVRFEVPHHSPRSMAVDDDFD